MTQIISGTRQETCQQTNQVRTFHHFLKTPKSHILAKKPQLIIPFCKRKCIRSSLVETTHLVCPLCGHVNYSNVWKSGKSSRFMSTVRMSFHRPLFISIHVKNIQIADNNENVLQQKAQAIKIFPSDFKLTKSAANIKTFIRLSEMILISPSVE